MYEIRTRKAISGKKEEEGYAVVIRPVPGFLWGYKKEKIDRVSIPMWAFTMTFCVSAFCPSSQEGGRV